MSSNLRGTSVLLLQAGRGSLASSPSLKTSQVHQPYAQVLRRSQASELAHEGHKLHGILFIRRHEIPPYGFVPLDWC